MAVFILQEWDDWIEIIQMHLLLHFEIVPNVFDIYLLQFVETTKNARLMDLKLFNCLAESFISSLKLGFQVNYVFGLL